MHILKKPIIRTSLLSVLLITIVSCAGDTPETAQKPEIDYAAEVRAEFLHAWNGYKEFAWGHDALEPLSGGYHDWYGESLLMTPVDAFDTMVIMGLDKEAAEAKALIFKQLDFDKDLMVQNFEISIRILGGLLSAYQVDGDQRFLDLAEDLATRLLPAFDSPTGMPYRMVHLQSGKTDGKITNPAEIGTYFLEFGTLSKLTGNPVFYDTTKKAMVELHKRRGKTGLVGGGIDVETGEWVNTSAHLSGGIDSYYEYLIKGWLLFGDKDFKTMWDETIVPINRYLADERDNGLWYGFADMDSGERTDTRFGALDCFFPAVLVLGGDLDRAARLQDSCFKLWNLYGVEAEQIDYSSMEATSPFYMLRPEVIESAWYLQFYTGDKKYREMGITFLESLKKYCRVEKGYAQIKDVTTMEKVDSMESFFLAETLKYLYLLFAEKGTVSLDEVVFNTEAHPLRNTWDK